MFRDLLKRDGRQTRGSGFQSCKLAGCSVITSSTDKGQAVRLVRGENSTATLAKQGEGDSATCHLSGRYLSVRLS